MSGHLVQLGLGVLFTCSAGCTSWSRLTDNRPVPTRGTIQVWSRGQPVLLREPRQVGDSLVGQGPLADTTRRAVVLTTIDSLRVQTTDMGKTLIVGTGLGIALLLAYAQGLEGNRQ